MDQTVKAKWVAALRDPSRKQVIGVLNKGGGMCCLGVLCDVMNPDEWTALPFGGMAFGGEGHDIVPPQCVREWAGFELMSPKHPERVIPKVVINGVKTTLDAHNDAGRTFAAIADAIEAQL